MPLFTRRSNISATSTFFGVSADTKRTSVTLPSKRRGETNRSRRVLPKYPSARRQKEITTASTSTLKTGYMINDLESSDSSESSATTTTDQSNEYLKTHLLSNGNFVIEGSSDSDSASSMGTSISNVSYSCNDTPKQPEVRFKAILKFTCEGSGPVTCVSAARSGQAWVCRGNDRHLMHLYHRNGFKKETRTLNTKVEDIAVRQDKSVFIVPYQSQMIKRVSTAGKLTDFYSSLELATSGICATSRSEILITTKPVEISQKKRPRARARPSVMRLTQTGEIIWDIKNKGADPFVKPGRLNVSKNGDICVIDGETSREHVVILTPDGKLRGKYYGVKDPILARAFDPKDVCYDKNGFIYVADLVNSAVHVLDKQGNFHHFLFTSKDGIQYPSALACDTDGFVWSGCATGYVFIFDVNHLEQSQVSSRKPSYS